MTGLIVDLFAGGGGTSVGIKRAIGRSPDIAINHDAEAIAMHEANHPETLHLRQDVRKINIRKVVNGRRVSILWLSPDCKHHSKAKGGKPVDRKIRGLAWEGVRWAEQARPDMIFLENVEEFRDWGPLNKANLPDKLRKGFTYNRFKAAFRRLGYKVEDNFLRAADYGAPTTRRRLFLIARCDGLPIVWPRTTHSKGGAGGLLPWLPAGDFIDFGLPCPSIFLDMAEAKRLRVKRPLAEKTQRRINRGIVKYVIETANPYIVRLPSGDTAPFVGKWRHDSAGRSLHDPSFTITAGPKENPAGAAHALGLISPSIIPVNHGGGENRARSAREPITTITGAHRGEHALVAPLMVPRYGEREGQAPRTRSVREPAATIVPTQNGDNLALAFMAKHYGGHETPGSQLSFPVDAITAKDHNAIVAAHVQRDFGQSVGSAPVEPVGTITPGGGGKSAVIASSLMKMKGTCKDGQSLDRPIDTIQAQGYHYAEVRAFLMKYHDSGGQWNDLFDPSPTVVANDSIGLVMVDGWPHVIVDIGMRMLIARELFLLQGFDADYIIAPVCDRIVRGKVKRGPLPADAQVRMCGNSVPPQFPEALIRANLPAVEEVAA